MQFRLLVEYDGTDFSGWQVQPGERTVQGALEEALEHFLGVPTRVAAAGRTDAGVHASGQVVCFFAARDLDPALVRRAVQALSPRDIGICTAEIVADDFDPRRRARRRAYDYRIWNRTAPSPFWRRYAWHLRRRLDDGAMQRAARLLEGEHDFSAFRAVGCDAAGPVRRVFTSRFERDGDLIVYRIEATAFLRHMVRNIVGTLVEVGSGRRDAAAIPALLAARDRGLAGPTAPAHGLCLTRVDY
jgi:tRNA pseudouridine38-40 synthase